MTMISRNKRCPGILNDNIVAVSEIIKSSTGRKIAPAIQLVSSQKGYISIEDAPVIAKARKIVLTILKITGFVIAASEYAFIPMKNNRGNNIKRYRGLISAETQ
jgi:hypothetical protein